MAPTKHARVAARVCELMPALTVADVAGIQYLEGGYSNANFRFHALGADYVIRLPHGAQPFVDRASEAHWLERLPADLTPELVAFDEVDGAMITCWVEGRLLVEAIPYDIEDLAARLRDLHVRLPRADRAYDPIAMACTYLSVGAPASWIVALATEALATEALATEALATESWQGTALTACHNDLNPWNVIVRPDGSWVVLDWEFAGANDPLFDLAGLGLGLGLGAGAMHELAGAYLGAEPRKRRLEDCIKAFWLREYGFAHAQLWAANDRAEIHAQRATAQERLRQFAT